MKIGISAEHRFEKDHYGKIKSFGFDYYDLNMSNTDQALYSDCEEDFCGYLKRERAQADKAGVRIWQVHGPWRYPPRDETKDDRAERLEKMKRSIRGAAILGASYWVIHPIMPFGVTDLVTNQASETRALNLEFMQKLLPTAKDEGITVCPENMPFPDFSLSSPAAIADLVEEINDPAFAMCLDTGHANICKDWHTPAQAITEFGHLIKTLHVHDNHGRRDEHLAPFYGTIDWRAFSQAIRDSGFEGVISLECSPSGKLPKDILEDTYAIYARIATALYDLK